MSTSPPLENRRETPIKAFASVLATFIAIAFSHSSWAGSATWRSAPPTADWNTAGNWTPATVPNGASDIATFGSSNKTAIGISADIQVGGMTFNSSASAYTISLASNLTLTIGGTVINNHFGTTQKFVVGTDANHDPATILLTNNATVDSVEFINDGGRTNFSNSAKILSGNVTNKGSAVGGFAGGQLNFYDTASALNGQFSNEGGTVPLAGGGKITFANNATAGFGSFNNLGATTSGGAQGGLISFKNNATAGNASILNWGGSASNVNGSVTEFRDSSTAGSSSLEIEPGNATAIIFYDNSSAQGASIFLFDGQIDISLHNLPGITIGSVGGAFISGYIFLGSNNLTVGSINFDGVIQDGGLSGGVGGSLTIIGPNPSTLTSANTYTGPTVVQGGRLLVSNTTGSATGSGTVLVTNNRVFGGSGRIAGSVTVGPGSILRGGQGNQVGDALSLSNDLTLNSGSRVEIALGTSGSHSRLSRLGGTWSFAPNQLFNVINIGAGAQPGFYDNIITGLVGDPGGEASWTITNPFFAGTFTYDGSGNIDLDVTNIGGRIFITEVGSNRVTQYKTTGAPGNLNLVTGLATPQGIGISEGKLFVVSHDTGVVGKYTITGASENPSLISGLSGPRLLAIAAGYIYVLDDTGTIGKYSTSGTTINASLVTGLSHPTAMAVSGDSLFVTDSMANTIAKYTTSGVPVNSSFITGLMFPQSIAISDGKLFVANAGSDFDTGYISKYDAASGTVINASLVTGLQFPIGLAISQGYILVLDMSGERIGEYSVDGTTANATLINSLQGVSLAVEQDVLQVTKAVSRKMHGNAGTFDINLPLTGSPGVECRSTGGSYTIVCTLNNLIENAAATVTSGIGSVVGNPILANDTVTINLAGVAEVQTIVVTLSNVIDNLGNALPATAVPMSVLIGDTTANKSVNASDVSLTKVQSGHTVTDVNFRADVVPNGAINASDIALVKTKSGSSLPTNQLIHR